MSQSTPRSRRGIPPETPGSARSNTSFASTTIDRGPLLERMEDLDLEVHDLRRNIAAERERRLRSHPTSGSTSSSAMLRYIDPNGRDLQSVKVTLLEKLRELDDEALTRLLTASSKGLVGLLTAGSGNGGKGGGEDGGGSIYSVMGPELVPFKSVGVEGVGSASDIDRRLLHASQIQNGKNRGVAEELNAVKQAKSINNYLKDRERRTNALLESLQQFTYLSIDTLDQSDSRSRVRGGRNIHLKGNLVKLFSIEIQFDVAEDSPPSSSSNASPQIQNLNVTLPTWLQLTLNTPHNVYSKLLKKNDLPSILLMLRTLIPLISLRRNLFTSLMESFTDLVRDYVKNWEGRTGVDFGPWHPPSSNSSSSLNHSRKRSGAIATLDEALGKSLITPEHAQSLVLRNKNGASLTIYFKIGWNRFGHAQPKISATPNVPNDLLNGTGKAFLETFEEEFEHLVKTALVQDGFIVGLPDKDDEDENDEDGQEGDKGLIGRFGVLPALHAVIKAFFSLEAEISLEEGSSVEEEAE